MPVPLPDMDKLFPQHVPVQKQHFDETPKIDEQLDVEVKQNLKFIKRGDLGVPEHALRAASYQYAGQCDGVNTEFMLCKKEEADPRKCLKYGDKVSTCAADFFGKISEACTDSYVKLAQCIEHNSIRRLSMCRTLQYDFDTCVYEKLGFDKLAFAGLRAGKKIKTDRPKPINPYNFQGPILDTRKQPAPDFFEKPVGQSRDGDEKLTGDDKL